MKRITLGTAAALLASLSLAGGALAADYGQSRQTGQSSAATSSAQGQTGQQIRPASDLENFTVQSTQGQKIGKVDKVAVDVQQGRIGYVVVSAEEGGGKYIIPWNALRANPQQQTLTLNKSPEELRQAPTGDIQTLDRQRGREIHQFYGVSPYWEESGQQSRGMMMDHGGMMERQQQQQRTPGTGM